MKLSRLLHLTIFIVASINLSFAQIPEWLMKVRSIKPMITSKDTVHRLFGKPNRVGNTESFDTNFGSITVTFGTGECVSRLADYNVSENTVESLNVIFLPPIPFRGIEPDLSSFEVEETSDAPAEVYKSPTKGVIYDLFLDSDKGNGRRVSKFLTTMLIFPAVKYHRLECQFSN